jgi:hypothetical protein
MYVGCILQKVTLKWFYTSRLPCFYDSISPPVFHVLVPTREWTVSPLEAAVPQIHGINSQYKGDFTFYSEVLVDKGAMYIRENLYCGHLIIL